MTPPRPHVRSPLVYGAELFAVMLAAFGGTYLLWLNGHQAAYLALTRAWGIDTWDWPFFDLQGVLSWSECHRLGVDVLKANPCDPMNRRFNYGPPLLLLPFGPRDTTVLGLIQAVLFLATLCFVLRPRSWRQWLLSAAAGLSTASLYALERGNLDLSEFVLVAAGCALAARSILGRATSYALYFLGGAMKFYPFALLLLVLRERPRTAVLFALGFAILIVGYATYYWHDLTAIAALMPKLGYDEDTFGATLLGAGIIDQYGYSNSVALAVTTVAFAAAAGFAVWLAAAWRRAGLSLDLADGNTRHLLVGAVVMTCCFVVQTNITYRTIFFLFMLPGLVDLRAGAPTRGLRWIFGLAVASVVFCLWSEGLRRGIEAGLDAIAPQRSDDSPWNGILFAFFLFRETVWWSLIAAAFATILVFLRDCPLSAALLSRVITPKTQPAA